MKYTELDLRAFSAEEIYFFLSSEFNAFDLFEQIILCDELLQRQLPIEHVDERFESMIRKLRIAELKKIDAYDFNFSKATVFVAIDEIVKRGQKPLEWLYISKFEGQKGPVSRLDIDRLIASEEILTDSLLWRIGMDEWKKSEELPYLFVEKYYDQVFPQDVADIPAYSDVKNSSGTDVNKLEPGEKNKGEASRFSVVPGVMELLSFPLWIVLMFMLFFTGFSSQVGVVLPFIFSVIVLISIIPVGIGLLAKQKWAWSIKIATASMTIALLFFKIVVDQAGGFWQFALVYQLIIVGLLFYAKESYNPLLRQTQF